MDEKGQQSVELIFIIAISIMILLTFTLPISKVAIENNLDMKESLNAKYCVGEIANGINHVYAQGSGSRVVLNLVADEDFHVFISSGNVNVVVKLHDNSYKMVKQSIKCGNVNTQLFLVKGENKIIIEWIEDGVVLRKV